MNKVLRVWLAVSMAVSIFASAPAAPARAAAACSAGAAAQNGIKVAPSHGSVFYIDTGVTPVLDAGFIGYRVTNNTGSTQSDLWVQIGSFTGGKIALANAADAMMQVSSLTNNATGTSYFLLKATGASTATQTHTVKVYNHRPDLTGASLLYECDYAFNKVQETIKAAANKVQDNGLNTAAAIEVSDTSPELGQLVNFTVEGVTGNIGAGSSPDFDIFWMTPVGVSTWPTRALRLESVSITFDANNNWGNTGDETTYTNQLLITGANGLTNVDSSGYRITYGFRVIGQPTSTVKVVPIVQIASGTQVKHSDTGATGGTLDVSFSSLSINAALSKSVTSTTGLAVTDCTVSCSISGGTVGETYVAVPYRLTASASSSTTVTIDEYVDTPETGIIFKSGSATVTDIGRTAVAIADPVYIASESGLDPRPYHFAGPFTLNSGTNATIDYFMYVPVGTYDNTAYAKIGDLKIGATQSAMSRITVTANGTDSVSVLADTVTFGVAAVTNPATDVATSTAMLNGTVDPNGASLLTGFFRYGTSPTLSGAATATATTPVNGVLNGLADPTTLSLSLSGLTPGTTYYFRVEAGSAQGSILSFTTTAIQAPPTVATTSATGVGLTGATLTGTINPNLTSITGIQFIYGTSPTLSSGNTTVTLDDGTGLAALTAGGSSEQAFEQAVTSLTTGTTYYYKIRACTSALSGSYPNVTCSSFTEGSIVSFVAATAPTVTTVAATSITSSGANLNGTINANGATATNTFEYGTSATLSGTTTTVTYGPLITGTSATNTSVAVTTLSASTTYYFRAIAVNSSGTTTGSILNFTTSAAGLIARTLSIDGGSYNSTYSATATPPTITSTASSGTGTKAYTSSTTGVCTINASTGLVAFVTAGTCTIGATISSDGTYDSATATSISFSVTLATRTLIIDSGSFVSSYLLTDTPPTITSTPSAGSGTKTYSSSTTGVCTISASTGLVAFVTAGTCTIGATISSDGTYGSATATAVSFTITSSGGGGLPAPSSLPSAPSSGTPPTVAPPVETPPVITSLEPPVFNPPAPPACEVCAHLRYDLYIINPDLSERHTGTPWVEVTDLGGGVFRYAFEDATLDPANSNFDHDDIVVEIDTSDCGALKVRFMGSNAAWKHQIRLKVFELGVERSDTLLALDDDRVLGIVKTVDAKRGVVDLCLPTALIPPAGQYITVYEHIDYGGKSESFAIGSSDADLSDDPIGTDTISSFRLFGRGVLKVFRSIAFGGISQTFTQDDHDLRDNAIGQDTISSLQVLPPPAASTMASPGGSCATSVTFARNLAPGSSGTDVRALQTLLQCLGTFPAYIAPNGYFGPVTRSAVTAFQAANGLPAVGSVGPLTRPVLNAYRR